MPITPLPMFQAVVTPRPLDRDYEVRFIITLREMMEHNSITLVDRLLHEAAHMVSQGIVDYVNSTAFENEMKEMVRNEMRAQIKLKVLKHVDEFVEEMLA